MGGFLEDHLASADRAPTRGVVVIVLTIRTTRLGGAIAPAHPDGPLPACRRDVGGVRSVWKGDSFAQFTLLG